MTSSVSEMAQSDIRTAGMPVPIAAASGASGSWLLLAGLEQRLAVVAAEQEGEAVQVVA
jgi:hypothetical protein